MGSIPDLPPIREDAVLDASEFVAALEAMAGAADAAAAANAKMIASVGALQKAIDGLHGKTVDIGVNVAKGAAAAAAAVNGLAAAEYRLSAASQLQADTSALLAETAGRAAETAAVVTAEYDRQAQAAALLIGTDRVLAGESSGLAGALLTTGKAATAAGAAGVAAAGGWRIFGIAAGTVLHWVVAASAEFLAVAIPAAYALAAGMLVASDAAQNVQQHIAALNTATSATNAVLGKTTGSVLGLGNALQTAQNAAAPGVYTILGAALNSAKASMGGFASVGLQVVHMWDEFAARVTVDLQGALGAQLHGMLGAAVTDLQRFGQIVGNVGHAILNFASAMPGLAAVLLGIATAVSRVILAISSIPAPIITAVIALEEFYRWGGLAAAMLIRLGAGFIALVTGQYVPAFILRFGAALSTLVQAGGIAIQWIGQLVGRLGALIPVATEAGTAIEVFGADVAIAGATMSAGMIAGLAGIVAALAAVIIIAGRSKSAVDQFVASSDQIVKSASDLQVFNQIAKTMAENVLHMSAAQQQSATATGKFNVAAAQGKYAAAGYAGAAMQAEGAVRELSQQQQYLIGTAATVGTNLGILGARFHTSAIGALALANAAGVNLQIPLLNSGLAARIAEQQITNLKTGLGAMAAPAGVVGADMQAIGVQSQLASSKVGQVNQALDAFIASTTGGMNSVMQFNAALTAMGKDTASTSQSLTGQISSISRSAASMGFTLSGIGPKAQQSWQQFDAAVQQGNTVLDTMRTGMAEGVVSWQQYNNEVKAVGGSLLPFAAHNKTALSIVSQLAQEIGAPATSNLKTLAADFGITGKAAQNMATVGMEQAIAKMANLSAVARNLSATVSSQLTGAMASAITKFSGMNAAVTKYASDLGNAHAPSTALHADLQAISNAASNEYRMISAAARGLGTATANSNLLKGASEGAAGSLKNLGDSAQKSSGSLTMHATAAKIAAVSAQGFGQQAHTAAGSATGLASQASTATAQVRNLGSASTVTRGSLGTVNNEIRTTASAASGSAGPLGSMTGNLRTLGATAAGAAGQVRTLEGAIASLQSKSITLTTNMVTVTSTIHRATGGPVFPGVPTVVGEAGREMYVPAVPGYVFNHAQTEQMMAGAGGQGGSAAPAGPVHLTAEIHSHAYLDSKEVFRSVQPQAWRWSLRNSGHPGNWTPS